MSRNGHKQAEGDSRRGNRRRKYVINAAVQWKYAMVLTLTVFAFTCVVSCVLYGVLHQQARMRYLHPDVYTAEVGMIIVFFSVLFSTVAAAAVGLWGLLSSHKLCGPLFVLQGHMDQLARGKLPDLRPLRRKDEFKELYASFGSVVDSLKDDKRAQLQGLDEALRLAEAAGDSDAERCKRARESLTDHLKRMRNKESRALGEQTAQQRDEPAAMPRSTPKTPVSVS